MKIVPVPCLDDNYAYLIIDEVSGEGAVVDPVEPQKLLQSAEEHGCNLKLVLTTHHHWDHAGGNEEIKKLVPGIKVYGGSKDHVKGCTIAVEHGDEITLGGAYTVKNLRFALTIEPENERIKQKLLWAEQQRKENKFTVPSTIQDELESNPFMRVDLPELKDRIGHNSAVHVIGEIRKMKDTWKG